MKPLHVGLLVAGAAILGGLTVKLTTRPPVVEVAAAVPALPPASPPATAPPDDRAPLPAARPAPDAGAALSKPPVNRIPKNKPNPVAALPVLPGIPHAYEPPAEPQPQPQSPVEPAFVPVPQPQPEPRPEPAPEPPAPLSRAPLPPRQVILRTGMTIPARMIESVSSDRSQPGDTFNASLAEPLVVDGLVIAERGARITGCIVDAQKGGRLGGAASLQLGLVSIETSDGQRVAISTEPWGQRGENSAPQDAAKIGGGAALGAIIGAIAGGGKGAAIGAGVGGAAGTGASAATRGKPVNVPSETIIRFRLASGVTITERP